MAAPATAHSEHRIFVQEGADAPRCRSRRVSAFPRLAPTSRHQGNLRETRRIGSGAHTCNVKHARKQKTRLSRRVFRQCTETVYCTSLGPPVRGGSFSCMMPSRRATSV
jgi:hypothetical protein